MKSKKLEIDVMKHFNFFFIGEAKAENNEKAERY